MASITADRPHRVLREIYRHYLDYQDHFQRTGQDVIEAHGLTLSFLDLKYGVSNLAKRKKEAFWLHVICDLRQEDVAELMGITTVSVGQYVESAVLSLAKRYFAEQIPVEEKKTRKKKKSELDTYKMQQTESY